MWLFGQARPQPPQALTLEPILVSHPSVCLLLLQSANPAVQAPLHTPPEQLAAMLLFEQARPQPPQAFRLEAILVSHPSTARPLQSANGAVQAAIVHIPAAHPGVPLAAAQILPHVPQSLTFFCVSTHPSGPQNVLP